MVLKKNPQKKSNVFHIPLFFLKSKLLSRMPASSGKNFFAEYWFPENEGARLPKAKSFVCIMT